MSVFVKQLLLKNNKKIIIVIVVLFLVLLMSCSSITNYRSSQITVQEIVKYFRPRLVVEILPNLESEQYKEKIMYATYFFLCNTIDNDKGKETAVNKILDSEFIYNSESKKYTSILNDNDFFDRIETKLSVSISSDERRQIIEFANYIDLTNNGDKMAEYALSQVNKKYTTYLGYAPINGNWDSIFVSYCCDKMGYIDSGYYKKYTDNNTALAECKNTGKFEYGYSFGNKYIPFPGDIIFLNSNCESNASDLMGIVVDVEGTTITTVVGDGGVKWDISIVTTRTFEYNDIHIVGYYPLSNYINLSFIEEYGE